MSRWDKIITALILFTCIVSLVIINVYAYAGRADSVVVELDGKEYAKYRLSEIKKTEYVEINSEYGYNKIEISSDGVRMAEADCEDKLDVAAGKITRANEYIICLPHRLTVRICGGGGGADTVAY